MILKAHAKVNLHLDIGPRRRDGYHSLKTIFQEISLHDTLSFKAAGKKIQLRVTPATLSAGPDNLIVRALESLRSELGIKKGMKVRLVKRIPMGAGLGGGSSDAAAALWGGWMLWTKKKKSSRIPPVLFKCARRLGADVPFFLRGGLAQATGIGDKLTPLKSPPKKWIVLLYPKVHVSTPLAYKLLDQSRIVDRKLRISNPKSTIRNPQLFNSFEPVIFKKFPKIAAAKRVLERAGCTNVMMSGSGSTVFGFIGSKREGEKVKRKIRGIGQVFVVSTL